MHALALAMRVTDIKQMYRLHNSIALAREVSRVARQCWSLVDQLGVTSQVELSTCNQACWGRGKGRVETGLSVCDKKCATP